MPCQDSHLRDIPGKARHEQSVSANITPLIAQLLKRSTKNPTKDKVVLEQYEAVLKIVENMHAHMIAFISKMNITSIHTTSKIIHGTLFPFKYKIDIASF